MRVAAAKRGGEGVRQGSKQNMQWIAGIISYTNL